MAGRVNTGLTQAKKNQSDEFYTLFEDINKEMNAYLEYNPDTFKGKTILLPCDDPEWSNFTKYFAMNFEKLGIKKLISTSYANASKNRIYGSKFEQISIFELDSPKYDEIKAQKNGKIFILERDVNHDNKIDLNDLEWSYLDGDGDYDSDEVRALRDSCDMIITNPPFSKFRHFLNWILESHKQFMIIGNINCITYKEVFPLLKNNKAWLGNGMGRWISGFEVPADYELYGTEARIENNRRIVSTNNCLWLTNIDHGKRHTPIPLMSFEDNKKFSKHKSIKGIGFKKYDNYEAIDIPFTDAIPNDYTGLMGVPVSFMDKYCPEQFEIVGCSDNGAIDDIYKLPHFKKHNEPYIDGKKVYKRIFIKKREEL